MTLKKAYEFLKHTFDTKDIPSLQEIRQEGTYIHFLGVKNVSPLKDVASFAVVLAAQSLERDNFKALDKLANMRKTVADMELKTGKSTFKEIKSASFEGQSLYMYALMFDIEISTNKV